MNFPIRLSRQRARTREHADLCARHEGDRLRRAGGTLEAGERGSAPGNASRTDANRRNARRGDRPPCPPNRRASQGLFAARNRRTARLFRKYRAQVAEILLVLDDDAETDVEWPHPLRITPAPCARGLELAVVEGAAAHSLAVGRTLRARIRIRHVVRTRPFRHVAVHVLEAPGVGLERAHRRQMQIAVLEARIAQFPVQLLRRVKYASIAIITWE